MEQSFSQKTKTKKQCGSTEGYKKHWLVHQEGKYLTGPHSSDSWQNGCRNLMAMQLQYPSSESQPETQINNTNKK